MTSLASSLLQSIIQYISSNTSSSAEEIGSTEHNPLETIAIPGLITLLDVALYNAYENEIAATISSSHNLLAAWLDLKQHSITVLQCLLKYGGGSGENITYENLLESFTNTCLDASCNAMERLSTDLFSSSANLTDPFKSINESNNPLDSTQQQQQQHGGNKGTKNDPGVASSSSSSSAGGVQDPAFDTGRRLPIQQRTKDCWESPRLYCPDYINFDNAITYCQQQLYKILHHPFVNYCITNPASSPSSTTAANHHHHNFFDSNNNNNHHQHHDVSSTNIVLASLLSSFIPSEFEFFVSTLLQMVCHDIPTRIIQFRAANEADADVTKRLYLIKAEYRAPFRAFLESHQSLQRAPSFDLVEEYLTISSSSNSKLIEQQRTTAKNTLQKLLEEPVLVEVLVLEQQIDEIEMELAKQLFPFSELARYLEFKRARLRPVPAVLSDVDASGLQQTLSRLRTILCRNMNTKSGNNLTVKSVELSKGIRPLLLDLQGIPRLVEIESEDADMFERCEGLCEKRLDHFMQHLDILGVFSQTRTAFRVERKNNTANDTVDNIPLAIVRGCTEEFDSELFRCHVQDWFALVERQRKITKNANPSLDTIAESIRRAEINVSLASANVQSLETVLNRVRQVSVDREKRFDVLKEIVEDVCLREMNLHLRLVPPPDPTKVLELQPTSAVGFFGIPLQLAGEKLPIG